MREHVAGVDIFGKVSEIQQCWNILIDTLKLPSRICRRDWETVCTYYLRFAKTWMHGAMDIARYASSVRDMIVFMSMLDSKMLRAPWSVEQLEAKWQSSDTVMCDAFISLAAMPAKHNKRTSTACKENIWKGRFGHLQNYGVHEHCTTASAWMLPEQVVDCKACLSQSERSHRVHCKQCEKLSLVEVIPAMIFMCSSVKQANSVCFDASWFVTSSRNHGSLTQFHQPWWRMMWYATNCCHLI